MASKIGMSYRIEFDRRRIDQAIAKIETTGIIELPEPVPHTRDTVLLEALRVQYLADVLERVAALTPDPEPLVTVVPTLVNGSPEGAE